MSLLLLNLFNPRTNNIIRNLKTTQMSLLFLRISLYSYWTEGLTKHDLYDSDILNNFLCFFCLVDNSTYDIHYDCKRFYQLSSLKLINLKTIQNFLKQLSAKSHNEDYDYVVVCGDPFMC